MFKEVWIKSVRVMNAYSCLFSVAKRLSTAEQGPKMILLRAPRRAGPALVVWCVMYAYVVWCVLFRCSVCLAALVVVRSVEHSGVKSAIIIPLLLATLIVSVYSFCFCRARWS